MRLGAILEVGIGHRARGWIAFRGIYISQCLLFALADMRLSVASVRILIEKDAVQMAEASHGPAAIELDCNNLIVEAVSFVKAHLTGGTIYFEGTKRHNSRKCR